MSKPSQLFYDCFDSPLGSLWIVAHPKGLSYLIRDTTESRFLAEIQRRTGINPCFNPKKLVYWNRLLDRYFSGEKISFKGPVHFLEGSSFQQKVWHTLTQIPYAEVRSYRWIGECLSRLRAGRAVGNACGKNPIPILLPCHRVVCQNGTLGGYTGGLHIKRKLLAIEGQLQDKWLLSSS